MEGVPHSKEAAVVVVVVVAVAVAVVVTIARPNRPPA